MPFSDILDKMSEFSDVYGIIQRILPCNSAAECLFNYCIFKTINFSVVVGTCIQYIPHITQNAQTLYYIILHYITMVFATCIM